MNILKEFSIHDKCSYLDNLEQTMHYKIIENCSGEKCQDFIERGFRRFGKMYFRPICEGCDECKSIKIDVRNFTFSKSQRREMRKAEHIKSYIQKPTLTQEHIELFEKYHKYMKDKKGWEHTPTTAQGYYNSFVSGANEFGYEVLYFDEDKLIGVDLIDILPNGISSIYFYYDPDYKKYALGKLSMYMQIKFAKESNIDWIYMGYYVKDCPSLSYKSYYKPYLTLEGRPNEEDKLIWF
ncbi:arginyltransferase [Sulfurimonas lithotrophica]|uniref:Aspartate/glutamate leucyltransferase n=1 Tax=Sulfurimonas lithotrophica TaxID=2590022 RepID=A0A5P8NYQ1_9BACT|nr:arginyltransferase [Sulfurimonas lithotrophica]QFR48524.1 arginyltransferase [Sulfurimonas lithotrophica]